MPIGRISPGFSLSLALTEMLHAGWVIRAVSRFFRTPCYPPGAGPDFVNAVVEIASDLAPEAVLQSLHEIEAGFGRARDIRWGARTLDLDLIAAREQVRPDQQTVRHWINLPIETQQRDSPAQLILPHPRIQDRGFVLVPLCDIAPDWQHPVLGQSARALCDRLPAAEIAQIQPL